MKINLIDETKIEVTPDNRSELVKLMEIRHISPDSDEFFTLSANFMQGSPVVFEIPAGKSSLEAFGGWERSEGTLPMPDNAVALYWQHLEKTLGCKPFDLDLIPGLGRNAVCYTHLLEKFYHVGETNLTHYSVVDEIHHFIGHKYLSVENRKIAAQVKALEHINDRLLRKKSEPEYLAYTTVSGREYFEKNPKWGRYSAPVFLRTHLEDTDLLLYMANQWRERFATPGQNAVIDRIHRSDRAGKVWFHDRNHNDQFLLDGCNGQIKFEEFKTL
jgi:hypothetical protein